MLRRLTTILTTLALIVCILTATGAAEGSVYEAIAGYSGLYRLAGTNWLIESPEHDRVEGETQRQAEGYRAFAERNGVEEVYVYLINSSRSVNLDDPQAETPLWKLLQECYPDCTLDYLKIDSVDAYCNYFYKTDHHWNYKGSYEGYKAIIRMMLGEDEPLMQPEETVEFPFVFNGSFNKKLNRTDSDEKFTVYRFEYPEMDITVNRGWAKAYGRAKLYFAGKANSENGFTNHYGQFYGGENGLIEFSTGRPEKESIMIISNSFSNPVDMLIASHFNNTAVVDPRFFDEEIGAEVSMDALIRTYGITKILLIGDPTFFRW